MFLNHMLTVLVLLIAETHAQFCNRTLVATDFEQELSPPGYPNSLDDDDFWCEWIIKPLDPVKNVYIKLVKLDSSYGRMLISSWSNTYTTVFIAKRSTPYRDQHILIPGLWARVLASSNIKGFRLIYTQVAQCGLATKPLSSLFSPEFPQSPPPDVICGYIFKKTSPHDENKVFRLTFTNIISSKETVLQVYNLNGLIADLYKVTYRDFADNNHMRIFYSSPSAPSRPFVVTHSDKSCTGTENATNQFQTILSLGFPYYTPNNLKCSWTIKPTEPDKAVYLKIKSDNFGSWIGYRSIKISEGGKLIGEYKDYIKGEISLVVHSFPIDIVYQSSGNTGGYSIEYKQVPPCGFSTMSKQGSISWPPSSQQANTHLYCGWNLHRASSQEVHRIFTTTELQINSSDTFQIYNLNQRLGRKITMGQLFHDKEFLRIYFETKDPSHSQSRLAGRFSQTNCGTTLIANSTTQFIIPFGIPDVIIIGRVSCVWTINPLTSAFSVYIKVVEFDADRHSIDDLRIGKIAFLMSTSYKNVPYIEHTVPAIIKYTTVGGYGFILQYKQVPKCGGTMTGLSESFSSKDLPAVKTPHMYCAWNVGGFSLEIKFRLQVFANSSKQVPIKVYREDGLLVEVTPGQAFTFYGELAHSLYFELNNNNDKVEFNATVKNSYDCTAFGLSASEALRQISEFSSQLVYGNEISCYWAVAPISNNLTLGLVNWTDTGNIEVWQGISRVGYHEGPKRNVDIILQSDTALYYTSGELEGEKPFQVIIEEGVVAADGMSCITGFSVNGKGNFATETCAKMEKSCQTKIVQNGAVRVLVKRCKEMEVCENNAKNNDQICYGSTAYANDVHICHFCCDTPNCNEFDEIPNLKTEEGDEAGATETEGFA